MKVINVVGARPNFMKIAPIIRVFNKINQKDQRNQIDYFVVHTGQHYDYEMSKVFFEDLEFPEPDIYLGVGSGTHAEQTSKVIKKYLITVAWYRDPITFAHGDLLPIRKLKG